MKRVLTLFLTTVLTCVSSSLVMAAASSNSFDLNVDYVIGIRNFNEGSSSESVGAQGIVLDGVCYFGKVVLGGEYNACGSAVGTKHPAYQDSLFVLKGGMVLYDDKVSKISALALYCNHGIKFVKESVDTNEKISGFGLGGLIKSQLTEELSLDGYFNTILGARYTSSVDQEVAKNNFGLLYGVKLNYEIPILDNKLLQLNAGFRSLMEFHSDPDSSEHQGGQNYYNALYLFTVGGGFVF